MNRIRLLLTSLLLSLSALASADQLADLPYSDGTDPRLTLDIYRPEAPGAHPVVLFVPGHDWRQIDKRQIGNRALALTGAGKLVVAVNYRPQPEADWRDQAADVALALTFVRVKAREWGGDPDQLLLMGEGSGAHLLATLLAKPAEFALEQADLKAIRGMLLSQPQGLNQDPQSWQPGAQVPAAMRDAASWRERSPLQQLPAANWPVLLSYTRPQATAGRNVAQRLQNLGMAVTEVAGDNTQDLADREREWTLAWLKALPVGRVQRFETMSLSTVFESGRQSLTFSGWSSDRVGALLADRGTLLAGLDGATETRGSSRIVTLRARNGTWQEEFRFPNSVRQVKWLGRLNLPNSSVLAAVVRADDAGTMLWVQKSAQDWTSIPTPFGLAQSEVRTVLSQDGETLVMADGRAGGVWRLTGTNALDLKFDDLAEAQFNGSGAGLVSMDGQIYGVWRFASLGSQVYVRQGTKDRVSWLAIAKTDVQDGSAASAVGVITDDAGTSSLLIAHSVSGRITRLRPASGSPPVLEFELEAALRQQFGDQGQALNFAPAGFQSALHPETNERVTLLGIQRRVIANSDNDPQPFSHLLVRQAGGSYTLRSLTRSTNDHWQRGDITAMTVSPFIQDQGRRWFLGGAGTMSEDAQAWLDQGELTQTSVKRGPWWNRAQNGHGFDLQKIGEQYAVLFYSFATDGQPQWWSALGNLTDGEFVSNENGLMLTEQVLRDGAWVSAVNPARSGTLRIRFGLNHGDGACADGVARADALALADAEIILPGQPKRNWCIEPMQLRLAGNGAVDNNGLWTAGLLDSGWGISLFAQGQGAETTQGAIVYYYDGAGQPRWALGSGVQVQGRATLNMLNVLNACPQCERVQQQFRSIGQLDIQSSGACGDVAVRSSLELRYPALDGSVFARNNLGLQRLSQSACY